MVFFPVSALWRVFFHGDIHAYFYPYHVLPAALLAHGELPLWNPYAFSGIPLLADGQTALFHPASWLFFVLPAGAALNYSILSQFSIAGVGMFWLLRTLGLRQLAGVCRRGHVHVLRRADGSRRAPVDLWAARR